MFVDPLTWRSERRVATGDWTGSAQGGVRVLAAPRVLDEEIDYSRMLPLLQSRRTCRHSTTPSLDAACHPALPPSVTGCGYPARNRTTSPLVCVPLSYLPSQCRLAVAGQKATPTPGLVTSR